MSVDTDTQAVAYATRRGSNHDCGTPAAMDAKEFLARVLMHIPKPRRHAIRSYGAYSSVVKARHRRHSREGSSAPPGPDTLGGSELNPARPDELNVVVPVPDAGLFLKPFPGDLERLAGVGRLDSGLGILNCRLRYG